MNENRRDSVHLLFTREQYEALVKLALQNGYIQTDSQQYRRRRDNIKMGVESMVVDKLLKKD